MKNALSAIIDKFKQINQVYRPSRGEEKISAFIQKWASANQFAYFTDAANNVLVKVKGKNPAKILLQAHMDKVCTPEEGRDIPTETIVDWENNIIKSNGIQTLGADDGIGMALMMQMAEDFRGKIALDLLFTAAEEIGCVGASNLGQNIAAKVQAEVMLNLDNSDGLSILKGSAGGMRGDIIIPIDWQKVPLNYTALKIEVKGCEGGHSGEDINKGRANPVKILAKILVGLKEEFLIADFNCNSAYNAIPSHAEAIILVKDSVANQVLAQIQQAPLSELDIEPNLEVAAVLGGNVAKSLSLTAGKRFLAVVEMAYFGVLKTDKGNAVLSSCNLAPVAFDEKQITVGFMLRTMEKSHKEILLKNLLEKLQAPERIVPEVSYEAWVEKDSSDLIRKLAQCYAELFGIQPKIEIIHAGLEVSYIKQKLNIKEAVSIGPSNFNLHSAKEAVLVKGSNGVEGCAKLVAEFIEKFA